MFREVDGYRSMVDSVVALLMLGKYPSIIK